MNYRLITLVALLAAGCLQDSRWTTFGGPSRPSRQPAPVVVATAAPVHVEPPVAPKVNVFGEINGRFITPDSLGTDTYQKHTSPDEGKDADVAVDPTGKWLVFTSTRHSEHPKIYLQHPDGQSVIELTSDNADDANPVFSPDGKWIAFASTRSGNWNIYMMDVEGKNVTQVTSGRTQDLHPTFSPDGQWLAYCSAGTKSGQWELWISKLATSEKRMIGYGLFPSWSPSKEYNRIAFQRARQRGSHLFTLWTLDLVDGEARSVTEIAASENAAIVTPAWSPDGKKLAFTTILQNAANPNHSQHDIWTISADGSARHRITDGAGANLSPFWSVDNKVYFVSDRGGNECVWSASSDAATETVAVKHETKPAVEVKPESKAEPKTAVGTTDSHEVAH
jgi:TolB protein